MPKARCAGRRLGAAARLVVSLGQTVAIDLSRYFSGAGIGGRAREFA